MLIALVAQALFLGGSIGVVFVLPQARDEPAFEAAKTIYLPERQLAHEASLAEFQQAAGAPLGLEKLAAEHLLSSDLPPLPELMPTTTPSMPRPTPLANAESLLQSAGLLSTLDGLDAGSSSFQFLGIDDEATRIVIAFDISASVVNNMAKAGWEIDTLLAETKRVIEGMNANTLVNLIQFSRDYEVFSPHPVPATKANKGALASWLNEHFVRNGRSRAGWQRGEPNGIQAVLKAALLMNPDVIILLSDASFQRTPTGGGNQNVPWDELAKDLDAWQAQRTQPARLHLVTFGAKEPDRGPARRLARRHGGHYREY